MVPYKKSLKITKEQIEERQTTQCPNEKVEKDKQLFTKNWTQKTKDQPIRIPLKIVG
jgi:hypothetical protein